MAMNHASDLQVALHEHPGRSEAGRLSVEPFGHEVQVVLQLEPSEVLHAVVDRYHVDDLHAVLHEHPGRYHVDRPSVEPFGHEVRVHALRSHAA
eukprot:10758318-Alexandrium_andersonii.AAC.1